MPVREGSLRLAGCAPLIGYLLVAGCGYVGEPLASNREVGVPHTGALIIEQRGEPICPAAIVPSGVLVVESFGEAVTESGERLDPEG